MTDALTCRRALEALRNGVPNADAVKILGCIQPEAERRFGELLSGAGDAGGPPAGAAGMLVSGDFGAGKSHLLTYLEQQALARGFVCSKVAISKETPLYDLGKVFKAAVDNGRIPDRNGRLIEELGQALDPNSGDYEDFRLWADDPRSSRLSRMFPASLLVHERSNDLALNGEIENFWAGDRILISKIKSGLRQIGQLQHYKFRAPRAAELPPQRLRFLVELIKAAGYRGWVVLLDEIELVGSYSLLQRGRSYAELARWLGRAAGEPYPGLVAVGTVTDDFAATIISPDGDKKDRDYVKVRLERGDRYRSIADLAVTGMNLLERGDISLVPPHADDVRETVEKLRGIYATAYGWDAPVLREQARGAGYQNRMRYKVRASINEWDLLRLYPDARPEIEVEEFRPDYVEDADLEQSSPDDEQ
ncbi:MAG: DUF2791 family P-loop domain-containing protein [Rhodospirillaceae bacterium]|nr:DUF2791 family P-loop domain-containing protein [Rhodospirillaceae bacterium]